MLNSAVAMSRPRRALALPRLVWAAVGLAALAASVALIGPWAFALWLLPDLSVAAGGRNAFTGDGRLSPRAVAGYNAAHALPGPVALTLVGLVASPVAAAAGVLWLSHVCLDRALGYGLRAADGSQRG